MDFAISSKGNFLHISSQIDIESLRLSSQIDIQSTAPRWPLSTSREGPWRASAAPALTKRLPRGRRRIPRHSLLAFDGPGAVAADCRAGSAAHCRNKLAEIGERRRGAAEDGHAGGREAGGWLSWSPGGRRAERGACRARGAAQDRARGLGTESAGGAWRDVPSSARDWQGPRRQTAPARRCVPSLPGRPGLQVSSQVSGM